METEYLFSSTKAKSLLPPWTESYFNVPQGLQHWKGAAPSPEDEIIAMQMSLYFPLDQLANIASEVRLGIYAQHVTCQPTYHWTKGSKSLVTLVQFADGLLWALKLVIPEKVLNNAKSFFEQTITAKIAINGTKQCSDVNVMANNRQKSEGVNSQACDLETQKNEARYKYEPYDDNSKPLHQRNSEGDNCDVIVDDSEDEFAGLEYEPWSIKMRHGPKYEENNEAFQRLEKEFLDGKKYRYVCHCRNDYFVNKRRSFNLPITQGHKVIALKSIIGWLDSAMMCMDYVDGFTAQTLIRLSHCNHKSSYTRTSHGSRTERLEPCDSPDLERGYHSYFIDEEGNKTVRSLKIHCTEETRYLIWFGLAKASLSLALNFPAGLSPKPWAQDHKQRLEKIILDYSASADSRAYGKEVSRILYKALENGLPDNEESIAFLTNIDIGGANVICDSTGEIISIIDCDSIWYASKEEWAQPPARVGLNWFSFECRFCGEYFSDALECRNRFVSIMKQAGMFCGLDSRLVDHLASYHTSVQSTFFAGLLVLESGSEESLKNYLMSHPFQEFCYFFQIDGKRFGKMRMEYFRTKSNQIIDSRLAKAGLIDSGGGPACLSRTALRPEIV